MKNRMRHIAGGIESIGEPKKSDIDVVQKFMSITPDWADKSITPILATEGWMSRGGVDRMGDIVEPSGWRIENFLKYPVFMFNHDWRTILLGIWTDIEIRQEGLFGRNVIYGTKQGEDVALLVKAGVYRAYSVGFNPIEFTVMEEGGLHFIEQELIETSLVPSPAHLGATIETVDPIKNADLVREAKEHNLTLKFYTSRKPGSNRRIIMDPELQKDVEVTIAKAIKDQTEITTKELGPKFETLARLEKQLTEIASQPQLSEGDVKTLIENVTADFSKAYNDLKDEIKTLKAKKNVIVDRNILPGTIKELVMLEPSVIRGTVPSVQADQLICLQKMNDDIMGIDIMLECASRNNGGQYHQIDKIERRKSLHLFKRASAFAKAMDTETAGEGEEWVPIGFSGSLIEDIRQETLVASQFQEVQMTAKTMEIDTDDGDTFAKLIGEKITLVSGFDSNEETYSSGDMTLISKKARGRYQISTELTEDAAFAVMPLYMKGITRSIARSEDRSIINGNDGADADLDSGRALASTDFRKAFDGLRHAIFQTINSGSADAVIGVDGSTHNETKHTTCRGQMGKYGRAAADLRIFCSVKGHLLRLLNKDEMENFQTLDKYGPNAVVLQGELGRIYNVPVIESEFVDDDLNAVGIFDNVTVDRTVFIYCNTDMFLRGIRRGVEVLTERDNINDVWNMVAFKRLDFKPTFTPSSTVTSVNWIFNVATS